jgi:hypothetical protein
LGSLKKRWLKLPAGERKKIDRAKTKWQIQSRTKHVDPMSGNCPVAGVHHTGQRINTGNLPVE